MREGQRTLGLPGAVVEGRDIGSVVFPDAPVKLFLTAAPERGSNGERSNAVRPTRSTWRRRCTGATPGTPA